MYDPMTILFLMSDKEKLQIFEIQNNVFSFNTYANIYLNNTDIN